MAINPSGVVAGNPQNQPGDANVPRTRSTFDLKYHFFNTHRFGEYMPHYVEELNKDEDFPINSSHDLRSYTLESPLMQSVKRVKDYFLVPMEAILPLNWEKFFDNPVRGDDVLDDVGPTVENFWTKVKSLVSNCQAGLTALLADASTTEDIALLGTLRYLILGEFFYSNGSLMSSLGAHGAPYGRVSDGISERSWDYMFDSFITALVSHLGSDGYFTLSVDGYNYEVNPITSSRYFGRKAISVRHALALMRDNPTFTVFGYYSSNGTTITNVFKSLLAGYTLDLQTGNTPFQLSRLWAYQLCVAHYMSNDHIDFVYSAELYRQLIGNYLYGYYSSNYDSNAFFTRNGIRYQYDYLSAHFASAILTSMTSALYGQSLLTSTSGFYLSILGYLSALFGYRRSLRYLDYFTGSRAFPLAVVSNGPAGTVAVNSNMVNVIDIIKGIQGQRFRNAVNRVRHNFEGYLKGIFGGADPAPDYHNPFWLAHTDDVVFGQEVENTGAAQMSDGIAITTSLRSNSGNYVFEIHSDRPSIAIGITSYDIPRVYSKTIERDFFHLNRFDWFNPFMQYTGDQPIYINELGIAPTANSLASLNNFSYTLRHMEYKQRFNQCAGAFAERLPGWLFLAEDFRGNQANINPDWIRSVNSEFDRFYISLTGYSLGTYFHFIVDDYNTAKASRPMAYAPSLL